MLWLAAPVALLAIVAAAGTIRADAPPAPSQAEDILAMAGRKTGLCVHLGCGRKGSAALTAELAAAGGMLVHGLAVNQAAADRARQTIVQRGLAGQASVEKAAIHPLPYLRDLANLVVIEDFAELAAQGLTWPEVERIVAPGGVICVKRDGRWTAARKPRPKEMDDWTHPAHGPDGNRVSADGLVTLPVGLRWLDGVPVNWQTYSTSRGWVVAGGRCFTLGPTVLENVAPAGYLPHKREEYLIARDAFNGLPLWQVDCETLNTGSMVSTYNFAPLASDGRRVYAYKKDRLVAFDAESGRIVVQYSVRFPAERLLLLDGVLVCSQWEGKEEAKETGHHLVYAVHSVAKTGVGAVEAFDARDGTRKWSLPRPAQEIVAADGAVFLLLEPGNPPVRQEILALDLHTGRERWRIGPGQLAPDPAMHLNCAGCGVLVVGHVKTKIITVHSASDGRKLWEINPATSPSPNGLLWTPLVDGLLWRGGHKYDPRTGEVKGVVPPRIEAEPCSPPVVVGHYVVYPRYGAFWDMAVPKNDANLYRYRTYQAMRGACIAGATPANGMFYAGQNFCTCLPGQVPGFVAYGPCGEVPGPADFEKARPVEHGPAFAAVSPAVASADDWPMYRHDPQRSGATQLRLPPQLGVLWRTEVAPPVRGPLAAAWKARLTSWLTAPVAAEGKVFVAATDLGQVAAVDAATGRLLWKATVGARVDSPPAIHRGLCIFGAHDGWVYALRARDGELAWRTRAAPWERRMVAFGQVESVWPAVGAVLVRKEMVVASAGRTSESDGGVALCALDAAIGSQLWATAIGTGTHAQNDVLAATDKQLLWRHVAIAPETGKLAGAGKRGPGGGLEGLHDGTWTRLGKRRSGNRTFGQASGEMFVWNESTLFGYECLVNWNSKNRWCFAVPKSKTTGPEKLQPQDYAWRLVMPDDCQVEAMALSPGGLLLAGRVCERKSGKSRGFLWVVSGEDGKKQAEHDLDSPPAYDGLAIAGGQAYLALEDGSVVCFGRQ